MKIFKDVLVLREGEGLRRCDLRFGARIADGCAEAEPIPLPDGCIVVPGFLDGHIHGAGGADAMDGTAEALSAISRTLAEEGTTGFLATTMTQSPDAIEAALSAARAVRAQGEGDGARLLGVHLEGPFLSERYKGAQSAEYVAAPDPALFERFLSAHGDIRVVTLAPERKGADALISRLVSEGVAVSIGHTGAKFADIVKAAELGASRITHTFNAQSPVHHREIGTAGAALLLDGLACELIADGIHVSVPAMKLLFKCKPKGKILLVTDAIRAKGLGDGESELGGQRVFVKGGEARLADGTLAGSVLRMNRAVERLVKEVGVPFEEAVNCASLYPAIALGIADETGGIRAGKRADLTVLGRDFGVMMTVVGGRIVYSAIQNVRKSRFSV